LDAPGSGLAAISVDITSRGHKKIRPWDSQAEAIRFAAIRSRAEHHRTLEKPVQRERQLVGRGFPTPVSCEDFATSS